MMRSYRVFRQIRKASPFLISCILLLSLTSLSRISLLTEKLLGQDGMALKSTQNATNLKNDEPVKDCHDQAIACDDVNKETRIQDISFVGGNDVMIQSQPMSMRTGPLAGPTFPSSPPVPSERSPRLNSQPSEPVERQLLFAKSRMKRRLWKDDPNCNDLDVKFLEYKSLPPCALTSFPGSGNTWARYMIEAASGVFTGSIYKDQQLYAWGYYGELEPWNSGRTVAQKTHDSGPTHVKDFKNTAILIIRNPYRAILSYHNFLFGGHTGFASISNFRRKDWDSFVHLQAKSWLELALNWTLGADNLLVVNYEDLSADPAREMSRILNFRGLPVSQHRLECLKNHTTGNFKRKQEFLPEGLEVFSAPIRSKLDRAIRYVSRRLQERGHKGLPVESYEFYDGADSAEVVRVACRPKEDVQHCDERINSMNNKRQPSGKIVNLLASAVNSIAKMLIPDPLKSVIKGCSDVRDRVIRFDPNDEDYSAMHDNFNRMHLDNLESIDKVKRG